MPEHPVIARLRECLGRFSSYRTRYEEALAAVAPLKAQILQLEGAVAAQQESIAHLQAQLRGVEGVTDDIEGALESWESSSG